MAFTGVVDANEAGMGFLYTNNVCVASVNSVKRQVLSYRNLRIFWLETIPSINGIVVTILKL